MTTKHNDPDRIHQAMNVYNNARSEAAILKLLEEELEDGDRQRTLDEIMRYEEVSFSDASTATVEVYWMGFVDGEGSLTVQSDKTIWTARKKKKGGWELCNAPRCAVGIVANCFVEKGIDRHFGAWGWDSDWAVGLTLCDAVELRWPKRLPRLRWRGNPRVLSF